MFKRYDKANSVTETSLAPDTVPCQRGPTLTGSDGTKHVVAPSSEESTNPIQKVLLAENPSISWQIQQSNVSF